VSTCAGAVIVRAA